MKLCMTELDIFDNFFCPKNWGNGPKIGSFFNNFHRICSIMNVNIIFCVPEQIPYLGKIFFWRLDQNALSQSDCSIFKLITSPKQIDGTASFLHVDTNP